MYLHKWQEMYPEAIPTQRKRKQNATKRTLSLDADTKIESSSIVKPRKRKAETELGIIVVFPRRSTTSREL